MKARSFCGSLRSIASHDVVVVAHEDIEALVDAGRVGEFLVGVAGAERRDGGVEGGGVTHAGVLVAGGERAGDAAERAAARVGGAREDVFRIGFVVGAQLAGDVYFGPAMWQCMSTPPGMTTRPRASISRVGRCDGIGGRGDDLAVGDPEVADFAVDAVGRIVDGALRDFDQIGHIIRET